MIALDTRPSVKDLVRVCVCVCFVSKSPAQAGGGDANTHTAGCKQIGEIMAIATKLYAPSMSCTHFRTPHANAKWSDGGDGGPMARNIAVIIATMVSSSSSLSLECRDLTLRKHLRRRSFRTLYA